MIKLFKRKSKILFIIGENQILLTTHSHCMLQIHLIHSIFSVEINFCHLNTNLHEKPQKVEWENKFDHSTRVDPSPLVLTVWNIVFAINSLVRTQHNTIGGDRKNWGGGEVSPLLLRDKITGNYSLKII